MDDDVSEISLLGKLRELRRGGRRFSVSIFTTYAVNFPFYENVVLRYLSGAGSRFNIVIADGGQVSRSFLTHSGSPRRAGTDYLLLPVATTGAFHPKILALFSEAGMAAAIGSHNLTEAGLGRNAEITSTFGFDGDLAPVNVATAIADYVLKCAGQIAHGDSALSGRLHEKLRSLSSRGPALDSNTLFTGSEPNGVPLLDSVFKADELSSADRILVLGPYFDSDLRFLSALRAKAKKAEITVAIQPDQVLLKKVDGLPTRTSFVDSSCLTLSKPGAFVHAKAIVLEIGKTQIVSIGSANPSGPAWLGSEPRGNFEAMLTLRGVPATTAYRALGLDKLWRAPSITKNQLLQIAARSKAMPEEDLSNLAATVPGLWKQGWIEAGVVSKSKVIKSIHHLYGSARVLLSTQTAEMKNSHLRFAAPEPGIFSVEFVGDERKTIVIASSASVIGPALVSSTSGRLIDELGKLDDGDAPGEDLLALCEKVLLQSDEDEDEQKMPASKPQQTSAGQSSSDDDLDGPRGISPKNKEKRTGSQVNLSLDISAIITLLLKDLKRPPKENEDPNAGEDADDTVGDCGEEDSPRNKAALREWNDVVGAIKPRITRILRQLESRLGRTQSAKWKYERVLLTLALLKRLRKFYPGERLPFSGRPARLVDDNQIQFAFRLAMRSWFTRRVGIIGTLDRAGGLETEHDVLGRSLLFWAAYEAGVDAAEPQNLNVTRDELRAIQDDRADAIIAAIAGTASSSVLEQARQQLYDRGEWREPRDRIERIDSWFGRHSKIGAILQEALAQKRPPVLPVTITPPSIHDVVIWREEPGWPRLPHLVSGKAIHLSDVGGAASLKISTQFVQTVDLKKLGIHGELCR